MSHLPFAIMASASQTVWTCRGPGPPSLRHPQESWVGPQVCVRRSRMCHPRGGHPLGPGTLQKATVGWPLQIHLLPIFQCPPSLWWATASVRAHVFVIPMCAFWPLRSLSAACCHCFTEARPPRATSMVLEPGQRVATWAEPQRRLPSTEGAVTRPWVQACWGPERGPHGPFL